MSHTSVLITCMWKYGYMEMCFHVSSLGGQLSSSGNKGSEPISDNNITVIDLPYTKFVVLYSTVNDMIIIGHHTNESGFSKHI